MYPDWSWMYFVDPRRLPWGVSILVLLGHVATLMGGYLLGWTLLRAHREKVVYGLLAGLALALLTFVLTMQKRIARYGTFEDFHAGRTLALTQAKLGWTLVACSIGVTIAIALVGFTLWEQGKRFRV
jgi:hypothetical protein